MDIEPQPKTVSELLQEKRQWTRKQAQGFVAFYAAIGLGQICCLGYSFMTLFNPPFSFICLAVAVLLTHKDTIKYLRSGDRPLIRALGRGYVDPIYPAEEARCVYRIRLSTILIIVPGLVAIVLLALAIIQFCQSSRSSIDLQWLALVVYSIIVTFVLIVLKSIAIKRQATLDFEKYAASQNIA